MLDVVLIQLNNLLYNTSLPVVMVILFHLSLYNVSANEIYELAFILTFEVSNIPQVIVDKTSTFPLLYKTMLSSNPLLIRIFELNLV